MFQIEKRIDELKKLVDEYNSFNDVQKINSISSHYNKIVSEINTCNHSMSKFQKQLEFIEIEILEQEEDNNKNKDDNINLLIEEINKMKTQIDTSNNLSIEETLEIYLKLKKNRELLKNYFEKEKLKVVYLE
jgi:hypothetical protein